MRTSVLESTPVERSGNGVGMDAEGADHPPEGSSADEDAGAVTVNRPGPKKRKKRSVAGIDWAT